jgi:hypothetical protein
VDEELREAERRGDAERAEALRRRAGLPAVPAELPGLPAALDEAQLVHDTAHEGGEFSSDPRGDLRDEADRRRGAVRECIRTSGLERVEALLRVAEGSSSLRARGRASRLPCEGQELPEATLRRLVASPLLDVADARCWPLFVRTAGEGGAGPRSEWARKILDSSAKRGLAGEADFARPEVAKKLVELGRARWKIPVLVTAFAYEVLAELLEPPRAARAT